MNIEKLHFNTLVHIATHLNRKELFALSLVSKKLLKVAYTAFKQKLIKDYRYHLSPNESSIKIAKIKYLLIENFLKLTPPDIGEERKISSVGIIKKSDNSDTIIMLRKKYNELRESLSFPRINFNAAIYNNILLFLHSSLENLIKLPVLQDLESAYISRRQMDNLCTLALHLSTFTPLSNTTNDLLKEAEMHAGFSDITKLIMPYTHIKKTCSLRMKYLQKSETKQTQLYITIKKETYPYCFMRDQNTVCIYKGNIPITTKKYEDLADQVFLIFYQTLLLSQKDLKIFIASKSNLVESSNDVAIEIPLKPNLFN